MLKSSRTLAMGTQAQQGIFPWFSNKCWERSTGSVVSGWTRPSWCSVHKEPSVEIWQGDMCFGFLLLSQEEWKNCLSLHCKSCTVVIFIIVDKGSTVCSSTYCFGYVVV